MSRFPKNGLGGVRAAALSWLAGSWVGRNGSDHVEEHWSPLCGDTLVGMFRWVAEGRVRFYELLAIEQEGEYVFLRIKHFDPKLIGWEERDRAHELVLVQLEGREAVFLELDKTNPRWAVYRLEGEDRLVSYFAREDERITETGMFEYRKQQQSGPGRDRVASSKEGASAGTRALR